jgi:AcrR family transcriptional regulator
MMNWQNKPQHNMAKKRNKEQTMAKLIESVGRILKAKGHAGIGVNKVALEAGVSKPMIYAYFGNLNGLLKVFAHRKDYWLPQFEQRYPVDLREKDAMRDHLTWLLQEQFRYFHKEKEMQKLILWQISEFNHLIRSVSEVREKEGARLLQMGEGYFRESDISLKAVMALLVGGIYFNVLQHSAGSGPVCGIDIGSEKDYETMIRTIRQVLAWAFEAAEK